MGLPNILLVEDNEAHLIEIEEMLEGVQANILKARTGNEAFSLLEQYHECALMIADIYMEGMDGFELLRRIREKQHLMHLPVIFITGIYTENIQLLRGYQVGAIDYLLKPLQPLVLKEKAKNFIMLYREKTALISDAERLLQAVENLELERGELKATINRFKLEKNSILGQHQYLATVSHEIRTPVNAILNFCSLLAEPELSLNERHQYLERIHKNGMHLAKIIDDIIHLARFEIGKLQISKIPFCLMSEVDAVIENFRPQARQKGVNITKKLEGKLPNIVYSDPTRFRQVLINLLDNSLKFTDAGNITVSVGLEKTGQAGPGAHRKLVNYPKIQLKVVDTGCGVSPEERERIFKPFQQGSTLVSKKCGGVGLGLTLSRQFAEMLGGDLTLEKSVIGKGSTFCFSLAIGNLQGSEWIEAGPANHLLKTNFSPSLSLSSQGLKKVMAAAFDSLAKKIWKDKETS